jgi:hypothetical protein
MWFGLVGANFVRIGNLDHSAGLIAAWLLIGVLLTAVSVGRVESGVWLAAWRSGRLMPRRSA